MRNFFFATTNNIIITFLVKCNDIIFKIKIFFKSPDVFSWLFDFIWILIIPDKIWEFNKYRAISFMFVQWQIALTFSWMKFMGFVIPTFISIFLPLASFSVTMSTTTTFAANWTSSTSPLSFLKCFFYWHSLK